MKRFLFTVCLLLCVLTSCQRAYTATDLLAKILAMPTTPDTVVYFHGADARDSAYLSPENTDLLYSGQNPGILAEEFALAMGKDDHVFEVHLYLALDDEKADQIENILRKRQTLLQKKDNELYDPDSSGRGATVWRKGKWVALVATEDNDAVKRILKQYC